MVKEKENDSKTKVGNPDKKPFLKDERVQFTIGLFTIFLSIYIFISFISYIFTWKVDQSVEWSSLFGGSEVAVENWTGKFGAILSTQFMNSWFGLASIALPSIIFLIGIKMLKLYRANLLRVSFKIILGVILFSLIAGFLLGTSRGFLGSGVGGAHGLFLSHLLVSYIGSVGTALVLLTLLVTYLIFIKPSTLHLFKSITWNIAQALKPSPKNNKKDRTDNPEPNPISTPIPDSFANNGQNAIDEDDKHDTPKNGASSNKNDNSFKTQANESRQPAIEVIPTPVPIATPKPIPDAEQTPSTIDFSVDDNEPTPAKPANQIEFETDRPPLKPDTSTSPIDDDDDVEFTIESVNEEQQVEGDDINSMEAYDPTLDLSRYQLPPTELLEEYPNTKKSVSEDILIANKNKIVETLQNYKIQIDKIKATIGPTVTLYEIVPAPGIRISKIKNLEDDIALSLAALGIRIIAPIPGKGTIGIEVPNEHPEIVSMYSILKSQKFQESKFDLTIALGKTISNEIFMLDLAKLPHLLVAGATGQGKSVGLNAIIASLLYKKHPAQIKFVLVDPKKVELSLYSKLERHFLAKLPDSEEAIITDTQKVVNTLNSLCIEMDQRYDLLKAAGAKSIKEYNEKFINRKLNPNKGHRFLPYIVVIIDEFADLIMTAGREVETPIARLAQLARAIGIHLIIATQRPSANIITGIIKANFPARIAFRVSSSIDSRTILDHTGANNLIGRGDMLVSAGSDMTRVQCAFIDTPEIERITDFISNQQGYSGAFELPEYVPEGSPEAGSNDIDLKKRDDLFEDAAHLMVQTQMGSTSQIQRRFSIGYNRAGRIVDQLEAAGIVGPYEGSKARQVLISDEASLEQLLNSIESR